MWQSYYFTFHVNWECKNNSTLTDLSNTTANHTYKTAGTYTITISATDGNSVTLPSSTFTVTVSATPGAAATTGSTHGSTVGNARR